MRIVIAEDSALIREGLAGLLEDRGHEVVARVPDGGRLVEASLRLLPDLVLTDLRMAPTFTLEGVHAGRSIRREAPEIGILVLSQHLDPEAAAQLVELGDGVGYLLKDRVLDVEQFLATTRRVVAGEVVLDPGILRLLVGRGEAWDPLRALTRREQEVLELMATGLSNAAIADALVLTGRTVETHIGSILAKLELPEAAESHRRVRAVLTYLAARGDGVDRAGHPRHP